MSETDNKDQQGGGEPAGGQAPQDNSIEGFPPEAVAVIRDLRKEAADRRTENARLTQALGVKDGEGKTELQRKEEKATAESTRADTAELRALRLETAAEVGLPLSLASRLNGSTADELKADASALKKELKLEDGGDPAASFDGGVRRSVNKPKTMNGIIAAAAGRG